MAADLERLVHGLQHRFEFAAQMGGVDRPERGQFFGQLHHFIGGCREGAGIGKAGGQAQGTGLETFAQLLAHRGNFIGRSGAKQVVEVVAAQRGVAHQRGDVERGVRRLDRRAVIAERRINKGRRAAEQVHRVRWIAAQAHRRRADPAIADDHRGHALAELGQHLRLTDHHRVVVGVHIDEAGRQHAAGGVDLIAGTGILQVADALDAPVQERHVGQVARTVAAVDDQGIANQRVVHHVSLPAASDRRRRGNRPGRV
ncbi:hypothetical protein D3C76_864220 [compost metagenome]